MTKLDLVAVAIVLLGPLSIHLLGVWAKKRADEMPAAADPDDQPESEAVFDWCCECRQLHDLNQECPNHLKEMQ